MSIEFIKFVKSRCDQYNFNLNEVLDNLTALKDVYGFSEYFGTESYKKFDICQFPKIRQNLIFVLFINYNGHGNIHLYLLCDRNYCIIDMTPKILCESKNFIDIINCLDTIDGLRRDTIQKLAQIELLE